MSLSVGRRGPNTEQMQQVRSWTDLTTFAGKIVAYKTNNDSFASKSTNSIVACADQAIRFGYIDKQIDPLDGIRGYVLSRFLHKKEHSKVCILYENALPFQMRIALPAEIRAIEKAFATRKGKLDFMPLASRQVALLLHAR